MYDLLTGQQHHVILPLVLKIPESDITYLFNIKIYEVGVAHLCFSVFVQAFWLSLSFAIS